MMSVLPYYSNTFTKSFVSFFQELCLKNSPSKTKIRCVLLLFMQVYLLNAEVLPVDKSEINYTTVYFEEEPLSDAVRYELLLFSDSLMQQQIKRSENSLPAFWLSDLMWAKKYYWKVNSFSSNGKIVKVSSFHQFSIMKITYQSYDEIRIDVNKNKKELHSGGLISLDYTRSIINRDGIPVWTIPPVDSIEVKNTHIRDLRITADNTITFLTIRVPYEIDFDGKLLWKAPFPCVFKGDTLVYHHDFKKTKRGTYMVLGERKVNRRLFGSFSEEELRMEPDAFKMNGLNYKKTLVTMLLEFDKDGRIIWYWDANEYLDDKDFNYKKNPNGVSNFASHANAFSENESGTKVYVGFRDLSRIVKVDKKTKKVEASYGERYPSGEARIQVKLNNQHDATVSGHNSIYVFNNNGFKTAEGVSNILELRDNMGTKDSAVLWNFALNFDQLTKGKSVNGGNIVELPNGNLLFCAGALNRVFEITKNKEILWDIFLYSRGINDTLWQDFVQYRANWIPQLNRPHFMLESVDSELKNVSKKNKVIRITNTGNVDDVYTIEVYSDANTLYKTYKTDKLRPFERSVQSLKINKNLCEKGFIIVKSNSGSVKKLLKIRSS